MSDLTTLLEDLRKIDKDDPHMPLYGVKPKHEPIIVKALLALSERVKELEAKA